MTEVLGPLLESGWVTETNGRVKITAEGRTRLSSLIEAERADLDLETLSVAYHRFDDFNSGFKQLVADWQLKDGSTPNDHSDAQYDAAIIGRLEVLHEQFLPLLRGMCAIAPRLAPYAHRFSVALAKVLSGEHGWLARPLIDSYHTVWFELHEDLIGLTGRSRVEEAAAGRAE
ncbi:hypothetical protein ACFXG4_18165 [Nocardia sp. NPDC059246]|uniref:hypothetical protein n=1 Tax=unclassified Nocardia TaxID=2637762 RepID=UPI00369F3E9A